MHSESPVIPDMSLTSLQAEVKLMFFPPINSQRCFGDRRMDVAKSSAEF